MPRGHYLTKNLKEMEQSSVIGALYQQCAHSGLKVSILEQSKEIVFRTVDAIPFEHIPAASKELVRRGWDSYQYLELPL